MDLETDRERGRHMPWIIGMWCEKGHVELYSDKDHEMVCGTHMRPIYINATAQEVAGFSSRPLPEGRKA